MSSRTIKVVQVQPQTVSSSSAAPLQAQVDENGKQIIKEINASVFLKNQVSVHSTYPSILAHCLGSGPCHNSDVTVVGSSVCIYCCPYWHLYLTSSHVHVRRQGGIQLQYQRKIALIDILEIKAVGSVADAGYCRFGTH